MTHTISNLSRLLGIAADNLHLLRLNCALIIKLEVDIFDEKCPDFITETIGIEMTLCPASSQQ